MDDSRFSISNRRGYGCRADDKDCRVYFPTPGGRDAHERALHGYHHTPLPIAPANYGSHFTHMGRSLLGKRFDRPKREQWTGEK